MPTCCWEWNGSKNNDGYGRFRYDKKIERAHAVSLSWILGHMPKYVMHLCDNPACVRPSHLVEGDHGTNMKDAYKKKRRVSCTPQGADHTVSIFTEQDIKDIRRKYMSGMTQAAIGLLYGVSQSHISQIVRRKTYKNVLD
jgi:hypothetical protein